MQDRPGLGWGPGLLLRRGLRARGKAVAAALDASAAADRACDATSASRRQAEPLPLGVWLVTSACDSGADSSGAAASAAAAAHLEQLRDAGRAGRGERFECRGAYSAADRFLLHVEAFDVPIDRKPLCAEPVGARPACGA